MADDEKGITEGKPPVQPQPKPNVQKQAGKMAGALGETGFSMGASPTPAPVKPQDKVPPAPPSGQEPPITKPYGDFSTPEEVWAAYQRQQQDLETTKEELGIYKKHLPDFQTPAKAEPVKPEIVPAKVEEPDFGKLMEYVAEEVDMMYQEGKSHEAVKTYLNRVLKGYDKQTKDWVRAEIKSYAESYTRQLETQSLAKQNAKQMEENFFANEKYKQFGVFKKIPGLYNTWDSIAANLLKTASPEDRALYLSPKGQIIQEGLNIMMARAAVQALQAHYPGMSTEKALQIVQFISNPEEFKDKTPPVVIPGNNGGTPPIAPGARPHAPKPLQGDKKQMSAMAEAVNSM